MILQCFIYSLKDESEKYAFVHAVLVGYAQWFFYQYFFLVFPRGLIDFGEVVGKSDGPSTFFGGT